MAQPVDPNIVQPRKGTGFTNLQQVIQANRPERLGQAIQTGVQGTIGQANTELKNQQNQFNTQSKANEIGGQSDKTYAAQAIQSPSEASAERFNKFRQGYQGPRGLQDTATLQGKQQQLGGLAKTIGTQGGNQSLLQRYVGGQGYNQGEQRLDSLLLGQSGGNLKEARRQALQGSQAIQQAQGQAEAQGQNLTSQAQIFNTDIANQLGEQEKLIGQTALAARAGQQTTNAQATRAAVEKLFNQGPQSLTDQERLLASAGTSGLQKELPFIPGSLVGRLGSDIGDISRYLGPEASLQASASSSSSAAEMQKANALAKLAGRPEQFSAQDMLQAGTYKPEYISGTSDLTKRISELSTQHETELEPKVQESIAKELKDRSTPEAIAYLQSRKTTGGRSEGGYDPQLKEAFEKAARARALQSLTPASMSWQDYLAGKVAPPQATDVQKRNAGLYTLGAPKEPNESVTNIQPVINTQPNPYRSGARTR